MGRVLLLALATLALFACADVNRASWDCARSTELGSGPGDGLLSVTVPENATDSDRAEAVAAVEAWDLLAVEVAGRELLRWDGTSTEPAVRRTSQDEVDAVCGTTPLGLKAGCERDGRVVYSVPGSALHELGHVLYLSHVDAGVMQALQSKPVTIFSEDDRAELARVWN